MKQRLARVLADFEGCWSLGRRISHDSGVQAEFVGQAVWSPQDDGLACVETGLLTLDGQEPMQSEQRYWWGAEMRVCFGDGRFFHRVPAMGGKTGHWCDPDQYDGHYDFARWPQFEVVWRVSGPRKSYCMRSIYSRQ